MRKIATPNLGIDFYGARPNPQAIKDADYEIVLRYLRNLTAAEAESYLAVGLGLVTIFETSAQASLGGAAAGQHDGATAAAQMRALNQPAGTLSTVNLSDFVPVPAQLPAIEAYWQAYESETSEWLILPYGTGWLGEQMNHSEWENAENDNGVLGSTVVPQAVIYQRITPTKPQIAGTKPGDYDEDAFFALLPIWGIKAPVPTPTATKEELTVSTVQYANSLHTFSVTPEGDLIHRWQGNGKATWGGPEKIASGAVYPQTPGVDSTHNGALNVFVDKADGSQIHCWQSNGGAWGTEVLPA